MNMRRSHRCIVSLELLIFSASLDRKLAFFPTRVDPSDVREVGEAFRTRSPPAAVADDLTPAQWLGRPTLGPYGEPIGGSQAKNTAKVSELNTMTAPHCVAVRVLYGCPHTRILN